ncbi:MAG: hypothetical protein ABWY04_17480 [Arthrobacter sp.]
MLQITLAAWKNVPPVARKTNPNLAAAIGVLFGGIGLGIYFVSVVDALVPVAIAIFLTLALGDIGFWGGVIVAGIYGFVRSVESNERLLASGARPAPGVADEML